MAIDVFAPAKLNLALHVTGRRADGYHMLDSFVVFAGVGDRLSVSGAQDLSLTLSGAEASGLSAGDDNLVIRAARSFEEDRGATIHLEKNLPVASGIGGGSADAAAALKALARLWATDLPDKNAVLRLGADVPVCLGGYPARMSGIGERLDPLPALPDGLSVVLVNPRVAVSTGAVFRALHSTDNAAMDPIPAFATAADLADWLTRQRNDLEPAARSLAPVISEALDAVAATAPLLTRMSGSGATVFGLFPDLATAELAAAELARLYPDWWVRAAPILSAAYPDGGPS